MVHIVEKIIDFNNQQKSEGRPHMLALHPSELSRVADVSSHKVPG